MAVENYKLSIEFQTILCLDNSKPEMTLFFDGFSRQSSLDLTVKQAKKLINQLQHFVDLSERSA